MKPVPSLIATLSLLLSLSPASGAAATPDLVIESAQLRVRLSAHGGELRSVSEQDTRFEYLWQNPTGVWAGPAPVLFPIVGPLQASGIRWDGRSIPMAQHGFARNSDFRLVEQSRDRVTFELAGGGPEDARFPAPFVLTVAYRLEGRVLHVTATIANPGRQVLPAALGFHPGFNIPLPEEGQPAPARLEVESAGPLVQLLKAEGTPLLSGGRRLWSTGRRELPLAVDAPGPDALVLACASAVEVRLTGMEGGRGVTVRTAAPFCQRRFKRGPYMAVRKGTIFFLDLLPSSPRKISSSDRLYLLPS